MNFHSKRTPSADYFALLQSELIGMLKRISQSILVSIRFSSTTNVHYK